MVREISDKQPVAWLQLGVDRAGQPTSIPVSEYRAIETTAGERVEVVIRVDGVDVANLGPKLMPPPKAGKRTVVVARMMYTDSAAGVKSMVPEVIALEERVR